MIKKIIAILIVFTMTITMLPFLSENAVYAASKKSKKKVAKNITLTVTPNGANGTNLKWNKIKKPDKGYAVFRNGQPIAHLGKKKTAFTDSGLSAGTTYTYQIKTYKTKKVKKWYNKATGQWQKKKPAKKNRGKAKKFTTYKYKKKSNAVSIATASAPVVQPTPEDGENTVTFKPGVIVDELNSEVNYTEDDDGVNASITIKNSPAVKELKVGDLIVLPENKDKTCGGIAVKISNIRNNSDGTIEINGQIPEMEDVFDEVDVEVKSTVPGSEIKIVELPDYASLSGDMTTASKGQMRTMSNSLATKIFLDKSGEIDTGSGTISGGIKGSVSLNSIGIDADVKWNQSNGIEELHLFVDPSITAQVEIEGELKDAEIELCKAILPIAETGFLVEIKVFLCLDADGTITFKWELGGWVGPEYSKNEGLKFSNNLGIDYTTEIRANVAAYVKIQPDLKYLCVSLIGSSIKGGFGGSYEMNEYDTLPEKCEDIRKYALLNIGIDDDRGVGKVLKKHFSDINLRIDIYDNSDSNPTMVHSHIEDGVLIESGICSHKASLPTNAAMNNGHHYLIYSGSMTWTAAKTKCESLGGHLVTITTQEEQNFIEGLNTSNKRLWIGAFRNNDDINSWQWVTGESWSYTHWSSGQPDNSSNVIANENCVALWPKAWNDLNNKNTGEQSGYICEWEY